MQKDLLHQIALTRVPGIGCVQARLLMERFETATQVFEAPVARLEQIEGIGPIKARLIHSFQSFQDIEKEIRFIEKYGIRTLFINEPFYPRRLLNCYDPPTLLYYKGKADLNQSRIVGVIGTRNFSEYGRSLVKDLIETLTDQQVIVISGLAYGIDALAHQCCIRKNIPTVGVLAHGLDRIYPSLHQSLAREMVEAGGGLLTEFSSGTTPDRHHFPTRNRVVAGLCDCIVVIESGIKGGSMVTASLANGYHRDVFAFPGRVKEPASGGCNHLIAQNQAHLLENSHQLLKVMGWDHHTPPIKPVQKKMFEDLTDSEQQIVSIFLEKNERHIDEISSLALMPGSHISSALLTLELKNLIRSLPGKRYQLL